MRKAIISGLVASMLAVPSLMALPTIKLTRPSHGISPGTNGGEFFAETSADGTFITFCLEVNETINLGSTYYYTLSSSAKYNGTVSTEDPLSLGAAWLYAAFATGNLNDGGTQYSSTTQDQSNLQKLLWFFENEPGGNKGKYYDEVETALFALGYSTSDSWKEDYAGQVLFGGTVQVVNVWQKSDGTEPRQDVIIWKPVPDAGMTLGLLGIGLAALGVYARRRF